MVPFSLTLQSLSKANLLPIMFACAGLALILVSALVVGLTWTAATLVHFKTGWLDAGFGWVFGIVTGVGGWFMLPVFTVLIGGVFQETVVHRVEKVYYPEVVRDEAPGLWPDLMHDVKFTIKALFLNLLILPLYFFAVGFAVSILLNSYLLGREFFEGAAGYHLGKGKARELGGKNRKTIYTAGLFITFMTLMPVVNIFVPVIATVWMVHVYHRLRVKV